MSSLFPRTQDIGNIWNKRGASFIPFLTLRGLFGDAFPLSLTKLARTRYSNNVRKPVAFTVSQTGQKKGLWVFLLHPTWTT